MSYRKPDTGNSMNDYFTSLADFVLLFPNLLNAKTEQNFIIWLNKLIAIDPRALVLKLRQHESEIDPEYMKLAQRALKHYTTIMDT